MNVLDRECNPDQDLLSWAVACWTYAKSDREPAAQAALAQLADEFISLSSEVEGLVETFHVLTRRKGSVASEPMSHTSARGDT